MVTTMKVLFALGVGLTLLAAHPAFAFSELRAKPRIEFAQGGDANGNRIFDPSDWVQYTIRVTHRGKQPVSGITVAFSIPRSFVGQIRSIEGYNADYTDLSRIRWVNQSFLPQETKSYRFEGTVKSRPAVISKRLSFKTVRTTPGAVAGVKVYPDGAGDLPIQRREALAPPNLGPPELVALTPSRGRSFANRTVSFITTVKDPDGWKDLKEVYLLLTNDLERARPIYFCYNVVTGRFSVRNPENTEWVGRVSDKDPVIRAGPVRINVEKSSAQGMDNVLTVRWAVVIGKDLAGRTYGIHTAAVEKSWKATPWWNAGQWTVEQSK